MLYYSFLCMKYESFLSNQTFSLAEMLQKASRKNNLFNFPVYKRLRFDPHEL